MFLATLNRFYSARFFVNVKNKKHLLNIIYWKLLNKKNDKPLIVNYIYVGSLYYGFTDIMYLNALAGADYVILDGFLIGWVLRILYGKRVERIGSEHYINYLFAYCARNNYKIFLLGGAKNTITNIRSAHPTLKISGNSDYIDVNDQNISKKIHRFHTDLLLVSLGLGKQEKWIYLNKDRLQKTKAILTIGFYGSILGGEGNLPPKIMDRLNMRWIYKLIKEPKRLWKRYVFGIYALTVITGFIFTAKLLRFALNAITSMHQRIIALILLIALLPILIPLFLLVKLTSEGPFIFKQKRLGKHKKVFIMYKIRTMVENTESLKSKYQHLNEADGPVFKIRNDPRYTKIGKILSHSALDEFPQLVNVLKGEMALVGPRPLPVNEALKVPKKYQKRFSVLPGITSLWIIKGAHRLNFEKWMELDLEYVKRKSLKYDIIIFTLTVLDIGKLFLKKLFNR